MPALQKILVQSELATLGKTVHVRYKRDTGLICSASFLACVFDYLSTIQICSFHTDLLRKRVLLKSSNVNENDSSQLLGPALKWFAHKRSRNVF